MASNRVIQCSRLLLRSIGLISALLLISGAVPSDTSLPQLSRQLGSSRDPLQFAADLEHHHPQPLVPLTLEDTIALELAYRSKTLSPQAASRTARVLCEEAYKLGLDPWLFLAVIHIESYYDHLAISPVGAEGLMQLMPYTASWFAENQGLPWPEGHSFDPELNVRLGARYLAMLADQFKGRLDWALTAYNRGPGATRYILRHHGRLPSEIREFYAGKVLQRYWRLLRKNRDVPGKLL